MSHNILFYPVGNGDTSQIILENGKRLLFDYGQRGPGCGCPGLRRAVSGGHKS